MRNIKFYFREGSPKEVFFESENPKTAEVVGSTIGEENTRHGERDMVYGEGGVMGSLKATDYKQPPQILIDPYNRKIPKDQKATTTLRTNYANGNPQIMVRGNIYPKSEHEAGNIYDSVGLAPTLKVNGPRPNANNQAPKIIVKNKGESQHYRVYDKEGIAPTLQSQSGMSSQKHPFVVAQRGRNPQNPKSRKSGLKTEQMLEANLSGNSNTLTGVEKDNYVYVPEVLALDLYNKKAHKDRTPALTQPEHNSLRMSVDGQVRKLMPIECERLMSFPDNWTKWGINEKEEKVEISDSQRYKMCGNGVVSNVVREVVEKLIAPPEKE